MRPRELFKNPDGSTEIFCPRCKKRQNINDFHKSNITASGFSSWCKKCMSNWHKEYHQKNPILIRERHFKNRYGITIKERNKIISKQNGVCAICGVIPKRFDTDHCHKTGIIRGLLCHNCNAGIGYFGENTDRLLLAIKYLKLYGRR